MPVLIANGHHQRRLRVFVSRIDIGTGFDEPVNDRGYGCSRYSSDLIPLSSSALLDPKVLDTINTACASQMLSPEDPA